MSWASPAQEIKSDVGAADVAPVSRLVSVAAELLQVAKRPLDALAVARAAVGESPNEGQAWNVLSACYHHLRLAAEQTAAAREAVRLIPNDATAWHNLSLGLMRQFDFERALEVSQHSLLLASDSPYLPIHTAQLAQFVGAHKMALSYLRMAWQRVRFDNPRRLELLSEIQIVRAINCAALLDWDGFHESLAGRHTYRKTGDFLHDLWEWGRLWGEDEAPDSNTGEALVYMEWGLGDQIQFARLIPSVLRKLYEFSRVTVACSQPVMRLMETVPGVDAVIDNFALKAEDVRPDVTVIPVIDLMREASRFGMFPLGAWSDVGPYMKVPASRPRRSRHGAARRESGPAVFSSSPVLTRHPTKKAIAFCWQGDPRQTQDFNRHIPFAQWANFAGLYSSDYTFHSLQTQFAGFGEPWRGWPERVSIDDCSASIQDLGDAAEIIAQCDVFVGQCGSLLHLAGAMGVPAVGMLGAAHDFRWDFQPLYDVKLVTQRAPGDWDSAFDQLDGAIREVLELSLEEK